MTKYNSDITLKYLDNMENGINISTKNVKGSRSHIRFNTIREKMKFFNSKFKEKYKLDKITDITEDQLCVFFSETSPETPTKSKVVSYKFKH